MTVRRLIDAVAAPLAFAAAVAVLLVAGRGELAAPPVDGFGAWLDAHGAVTASVAIARLAALAAAVWMFVVATVAAVARMVGATAVAVAAERAVPPGVRRALTGLAGVGAASAALLGVGRGAVDAFTTGRDAAAQTPQATLAPTHDTVTMSVLPPDEPAAGESPAVPTAGGEVWTVEPGDSFWSIAEALLAEAWGRPPADAEVVPYWRTLIDANRDRLVTADPDLILPGQQLLVPAVG